MKYTITCDLYSDDTLLARIDVVAASKKADAERMFERLRAYAAAQASEDEEEE